MSPRQLWQTSDGVIYVEKDSADAHEARLAKHRFLNLPPTVREWVDSFDKGPERGKCRSEYDSVRWAVDLLLEAGFTIVEKEPVE